MTPEDLAIVRSGDTVIHRPTSENWVVAFVDHDNARVWPCGWPMSCAPTDDCIWVAGCSDEYHEQLLRDMADISNQEDPRRRYAVRVLREREEQS